MTPLQIRRLEDAFFAEDATKSLVAMGRAGRAVVDNLLADAGLRAALAEGAQVLCGSGNNGGDGYVVARLLKAKGFRVRCVSTGDPALLQGDAATMHALFVADGGVVADLDAPLPISGLIVDAVFGTGLTRPVTGRVADFLARVAALDLPIVAVDTPSGLDLLTGRVRIESENGAFALRAVLTVTFHAAKPGHYLEEGPWQCGRLVVADIGLPVQEPDKPSVTLLTGLETQCLSPSPRSHKYERGSVLVVAGPRARTGAARLSARAALRAGAGLSTLVAPAEAIPEIAASERCVMIREGEGPDDLSCLLSDARYAALVIGPGGGVGAQMREKVLAALSVMARRGVVLDADALTSFADEPETLFSAIRKSDALVVLTPHEGEFTRLVDGEGLAKKGKIAAVMDTAARAGCVVLLKGCDTLVGTPEGAITLVSAAYGREAPYLATAGSGDVLSGILGAMIARLCVKEGYPLADVVSAAAFLHQEAGRVAGPGSTADDIEFALKDALWQLISRDNA